jgi:hypothetical protein
VSIHEVLNSFVLILPACVSPAGGRWENPGALTSAFFMILLIVFAGSQLFYVITFRKSIFLVVDRVFELVLASYFNMDFFSNLKIIQRKAIELRTVHKILFFVI